MSFRRTAILLGAVVGATLGGMAGWAYAKTQADRLARGPESLAVRIEPTDYAKIGISLLTLVRMVGDVLKPR